MPYLSGKAERERARDYANIAFERIYDAILMTIRADHGECEEVVGLVCERVMIAARVAAQALDRQLSPESDPSRH
jgi:hypothetical protein